jgi:hypothetical protein
LIVFDHLFIEERFYIRERAAGHLMLDSGFLILDAGYLILDCGYWMSDAGCLILAFSISGYGCTLLFIFKPFGFLWSIS